MAEGGPEKPKPDKRDLFEPTGELKGGYDMGMARAYALDHAKKTIGESVGKAKERRPLIWDIQESRFDEDAECFEIVLATHPEGVYTQQKGVWVYHVRSMGGLMPGTPLLRQSLEYTLPPRRRRRRWAWALLLLGIAVLFVVLGGLAEKAAQEKAARSSPGAPKAPPVSAATSGPTPLPTPTVASGIGPFSAMMLISLDTTQGPTKDAGVRQALAWAIDRKYVADRLDKASPVFSIAVPGKPLPEASKLSPVDAKAKLASYGRPVEVKLSAPADDWHKKVAGVVASYWTEIGVKVSLEFSDAPVRPPGGAVLTSVPVKWPDTGDLLVQLVTTGGKYNFGGYSNSADDERLREAQAARDPKLLQQAEAKAVFDYPFIALVWHSGPTFATVAPAPTAVTRPAPLPTTTPMPRPTPVPTPTPTFGPFSAMMFLTLDPGEKPLQDVRVRQALALAIDKKALADWLVQFGLTGKPVFDFADARGSIAELSTYDPARAKQLLAEAGYAGGLALGQAMLFPNNHEAYGHAASTVAKYWANIGVKVSVKPNSPPLVWQPKSGAPLLTSAMVNSQDTGDLLLKLFATGGDLNYSGYSNPFVDSSLKDALTTTDPTKKAPILQNAEIKALSDYFVIPLLWHNGPTAQVATPTPVPTPFPTPRPAPTATATPTPAPVLGKWELIKSPTRDNLLEITFVDTNEGWAVGEAGTIIYTSDGGASWQFQESGTTDNFHSVFFLDRQKGWALGYSGAVFTTADGGQTWAFLGRTPGTDQVRLRFVDRNTGWVVGNAGQLHKTEDGGITWKRIPLETRQNLADIAMQRGGPYGWIVGSAGTALYTTDAGATWSFGPKVDATDNLQGIYMFPYPNKQARAVGGSGAIYGTAKNDALTWQRLRAPPAQPAALWSVYFPWGDRGWAVGDNGSILHTINNGGSWFEQPSGTGQRLRSVFGRDPDHVWVVGEGGTILRYVPIVPWFLFGDDFNDGEDVGWQNQWGAWRVTQALTYAPTSNMGGDERAIAGDAAWTNYQVDGQLRIPKGGIAGLGVRLQNDRDGVWFILNAANNTTYWLIGKDGKWGSPINIQPWDTSAVDFSKPMGVSVGVVTTRYGAWLHGMGGELNNLNDTTYSSGKIGVHISMKYEQPASWDNISVVTRIP
ncbi:MAG: hypothetical protein HYY01_13965 [Chloroflexi bacterium]|nr:hypothetical protein [Chloroflexota bacterium]